MEEIWPDCRGVSLLAPAHGYLAGGGSRGVDSPADSHGDVRANALALACFSFLPLLFTGWLG